LLRSIVGQEGPELDLKELIHRAASQLEERKTESPAFSFSPLREHSEERLEFPDVQRIITLNDLAPSTQRHLSASPPSLPPRTPKSQSRPQKQKPCLTLTPEEEVQHSEENFPESYAKARSEAGEDCFDQRKQVLLEDSLGKRLFQHDERNLIYIEDSSDNDLRASQVSLNLSLSG
jgi:hypothetical protein